MFTESEQAFLSGGHNSIEKRSGGIPALPPDMPLHMYERALETRAKLLGSKFVEFRSRQAHVVKEIATAIAQNVADLF